MVFPTLLNCDKFLQFRKDMDDVNDDDDDGDNDDNDDDDLFHPFTISNW